MFFESDTFPFKFMLETCVHFDFLEEKKEKIPHIIITFEKFKQNFIPKIKMYARFQHKSEGKGV